MAQLALFRQQACDSLWIAFDWPSAFFLFPNIQCICREGQNIKRIEIFLCMLVAVFDTIQNSNQKLDFFRRFICKECFYTMTTSGKFILFSCKITVKLMERFFKIN